jgi:protein-disulfide isomerase/invasion protein IalB/Tfp pilus assembly protein PilF
MRLVRRGFVVWSGAVLAAVMLAGPAPLAFGQSPSVAELMRPGPLPDLVQGKVDAPVTIIEYSSMTSPHSAAFRSKVYPVLKAKYIDTGKVRFIFREFPLDEMAVAAAMLARCAGGDKTPPMIDGLFASQDKWAVRNPMPALLQIAKNAGLTEKAFGDCMQDRNLYDGILKVRERGSAEFKVEAVPTLFVDGKVVRGLAAIEDIDKLLATQTPRSPVAAPVARADQRDAWCRGRDGATQDQRIKACTEIIESGGQQNLASAYCNRAIAYGDIAYDSAVAKQADRDRTQDLRDRTTRDYDEAVRLYKGSAAGLTCSGLRWLHREDWDRALADFNEAIRLDPRNAAAYVGRGNLYKSRASSVSARSNDGKSESAEAEYEKALADYTEAIRLDPNDPITFYNRATLYGLIDTAARGFLSSADRNLADERLRSADRAIADHNEAIRIDRKFARSYYMRAVEYSSKGSNYSLKGFYSGRDGDHDGAIAEYGRAIAEYRRAMEDRKTALSLDPANVKFSQDGDRFRQDAARVVLDRGDVYLEKRDYDRAIADYSEVIGLDPSSARGLQKRCEAYMEKRDDGRATADCTQAMRLDPNSGASTLLFLIRARGGSAPTPPSSSAAAPAAQDADCAEAATHWKNTRRIDTLAAYQDHLAHFSTCAFAALAGIRIEQLRGAPVRPKEAKKDQAAAVTPPARAAAPADVPSRPAPSPSTSVAAASPPLAQPPAPSQQAPASAEQGPVAYSPWTKFCGKDNSNPRAEQVCLTTREARLETGQFLAGIALIEQAGEEKKLLRVTLPLGMQLQPGARMLVDQGPPMTGKYVVCLPNGCVADFDVNAEFVDKLKKGEQIVLEATNLTGQATAHRLPLTDFAKAHEGPPADPGKFEEDRKKLQAELEKKAEEARKRQPVRLPGGQKR